MTNNRLPNSVQAAAYTVASLQMCIALQFMMINPIFYIMATDFEVPFDYAGYLNAIFTGFSALSGLCLFWLRRPIRARTTVPLATLGMAVLTLTCIWVTDFWQLLVARAGAGLLSGFILAPAMALLINHCPPRQRGSVIAIIASAFSVVTVLGIPSLSYVSIHMSWQMGFIILATITAITAVVAFQFLSLGPVRGSETPSDEPLTFRTTLAASLNGLAILPAFILMPILVPHLLINGLLSENEVSSLFMAGGLASYLGTKLSGKLCTYTTPLSIVTGFTLLLLASLASLALFQVHAYVFYALLSVAIYGRVVAGSTLSAQYPPNSYRIRFTALQLTLTNLLSCLAFTASPLLVNSQRLEGALWPPIFTAVAVSTLILPLAATEITRFLSKRVPTPRPMRQTTCHGALLHKGEPGTLTLSFPAHCPFFTGHFPNHPVVPGVILLDTITELCLMPKSNQPWTLTQARFFSPVHPEQVLTVKQTRSEQALHVILFCHDQKIMTCRFDW